MSNGAIQGQTYLPLQGGELQGSVEMNGNKITGLGEATNDGDAVRLGQLNSYSPVGGLMSMMKLAKSGTQAESYNVTVEFDYVPMVIVFKLNNVVLTTAGGGILLNAQIKRFSSPDYKQTFNLNGAYNYFSSLIQKNVFGIAMLGHTDGSNAESLNYTQLNTVRSTERIPTTSFTIDSPNYNPNKKVGFILDSITMNAWSGSSTSRGTFGTFEIYYL